MIHRCLFSHCGVAARSPPVLFLLLFVCLFFFLFVSFCSFPFPSVSSLLSDAYHKRGDGT